LSYLGGEVVIQGRDAHHVIGTLIVSLSLLEVCLGFYSNAMWKPGKPPHIIDDKMHWYVGRLAILLAIVNIFLGIIQYTDRIAALATMCSLAVVTYIIAAVYLQMQIGQVHEHEELNSIENVHRTSKPTSARNGLMILGGAALLAFILAVLIVAL
jgi:hypothetical protein